MNIVYKNVNWWNYFKLNGNYSYGNYNVLSNASDEYHPYVPNYDVEVPSTTSM